MKKKYITSNIHLGFTMIELLIVLAIMSTLMGLVGPLAIDSFEKAQAKTEKFKLNNYLLQISYEAFSQGMSKKIEFEGNQIRVYSDESQYPDTQREFNYLFFQPQQIHLNSNGYTTENAITIQIRGKSELLPIVIGTESYNEK